MATRNNHALQLTIFTTVGGLIITALGLVWPRVAPLPTAKIAVEFSTRLNLGRFAPESPQVLASAGVPVTRVEAPSLAPHSATAAVQPPTTPETITTFSTPTVPATQAATSQALTSQDTPNQTATSQTAAPTPRAQDILAPTAVDLTVDSAAPSRDTAIAALADSPNNRPVAHLSAPAPAAESPAFMLGTLAPASAAPASAALTNPPDSDEAYLAQGGSLVPSPETWAEHYQDWIWGVGVVILTLMVWLWLYVSRLQDQLRQLRRQMNDRQDAFVQLHHQLQQATQEAETHQTLVAKLQEQLDNTQSNYHHSQDQCQTLTDQIAALQTRLQERRNEVAYVHLLEEENQTLNQTQQELMELQSQLEQQQEKVMVLAAERDSLSQQLSQVSNKLQYCEVHQITHEDLPPLGTELQHTLRIDCTKDLGKLPMKEFRQLMQRIVELQTTPRPHDSRPLNKYGLRDILSVDAGEYRICYRIQEDPEHHLAQIQVLMVDKRNDGTIYNRLRRCLT
ncbi:MAG: hypothetical protein VKJ85_11825 [Prochlorothrix sp.]|nr:hypothetical protein [Prochlorothrix sp.]